MNIIYQGTLRNYIKKEQSEAIQCVYVLEINANTTKVGHSKNVLKRLRDHFKACNTYGNNGEELDWRLSLYDSHLSSKEMERMILGRLGLDFPHKGEWFFSTYEKISEFVNEFESQPEAASKNSKFDNRWSGLDRKILARDLKQYFNQVAQNEERVTDPNFFTRDPVAQELKRALTIWGNWRKKKKTAKAPIEFDSLW